MHDPSISSDKQRAINEAVVVVSFAATGQRSALSLQMVQALPVIAIDDARATGRQAACEAERPGEEERGAQVGKSVAHVLRWWHCSRTYKAYTWGSSRISQSSSRVSHQLRPGYFWRSCCRLFASEQCPTKQALDVCFGVPIYSETTPSKDIHTWGWLLTGCLASSMVARGEISGHRPHPFLHIILYCTVQFGNFTHAATPKDQRPAYIYDHTVPLDM